MLACQEFLVAPIHPPLVASPVLHITSSVLLACQENLGVVRAGYLKVKCALGPFLAVLVIKCSTHYYELTLLI
jgi:hypothetical protein